MISVIIPCYNQAHFLAEAIESVKMQTYPYVEIIVVDDGSIDHPEKVVASYPNVRYIRQSNQGPSAARNMGLQHSTGNYLVFLDADDHLLPNALEHNLHCLTAHPECALAFGHFRLITEDNIPYQPQQQSKDKQVTYATLLQGNRIGMLATAMYRREAFEGVGGFNTSLRTCEDYDLYLRLARKFPIISHDNLIAEYRQHQMNSSRNYFVMLASALSVLRTQGPYLKGNWLYQKAYIKGIRNWIYYYGQQFIIKNYARLKIWTWQ